MVGPELRRDLAILFALKALVGAYVLSCGFTHVSDDDYARTVIAETFAHAPKLDPSGTSWLPLPFWIYGTAMLALGRSIAAARAVACVLGVASVAAPYLALRAIGAGRAAATIGVAIAMLTPWSAWTGVATVPEAPTAALIAAAAIACARAELAPWAALAALGAALSRYEAWPVAAVVAVACAARKRWAAAALAAAGPLAWIAWNAYAHGDALHFVARVAAFRRATLAADAPLAEKLLGYPLGLLRGAREIALLGGLGLAALAWKDVRKTWAWPLACAAATLAFLVYGDVRDGAPTHHPERALLGVYWILAPFGAAAIARAVRGRRAPLVWAGVSAACAACLARDATFWSAYPGGGAEDRTAQIARGLALRGAAHLDVTPCAYEHFALLAAFGAPERATIAPSTRAPVTILCPRVTPRDAE